MLHPVGAHPASQEPQFFPGHRRRLLSFVLVSLFAFSFELMIMKFLPVLEDLVGKVWADIVDAACVGLVITPLAGMILLLRERSEPAPTHAVPVRSLRPWMHGLGAGLTLMAFAALCLWAQNRSSDQIIKQNLDDEMLTLARLAASQLDVDEHANLTRPEQQRSPEYQRLVAPLRQLVQNAPQI